MDAISKRYLIFPILFISLLSYTLSKGIQLTIQKPSHSLRRLKANDISLIYEDDEDYFTVALGIGNPLQFFAVQIDTSASLTWVPSINCKNCNATSKYDSSLSSTVVTTTNRMESDDEEGNVFGYQTFDTIEVEGIKLNRFGFVQVEDYGENFNDHEDGKLGLGYLPDNGHNFNFLEKLKEEKLIDKKMFALTELNSTHGLLSLGDYPSDYDPLSYTSCSLKSTAGLDDKYRSGWVCDLSLLIFEDENATLSTAIDIAGKVIFDSAYSYISVPMTFLHSFKDAFIDKVFHQTCQEVSKISEVSFICPYEPEKLVYLSFSFILEGYGYVIPAEDLFEKLDNQKMEFMIRFNKEKDNIWSFGHPFMCHYTVVFDLEKKEIGLLGGEKEDFIKKWTKFDKKEDTLMEVKIEKKKRNFLFLYIGAGIVGSLLVLLLIFLVWRSIVKRRQVHGPLVETA